MRNVKLLLMAFVLMLAFTGWAQEDESKKMLNQQVPSKYKIDTRIDNMGYWNMLAKKGLVPVQQKVPIPAARNYDSRIYSKMAVTDDSPDILVTEDAAHQTENSIFIDPSNNQSVINSNNSGPNGGVYGTSGFFSDDAGLSWYGSVQGTGGDNSGDPAAAIGNNGRAYNGFIHSSGGQGVAYSDDQGANWTSVLVGESPGGWNSLLDKNHLWIDNTTGSPYHGYVYSAWTAFGGSNDNQIEVTYSSDDGVTWSDPQVVSQEVNAGNHNQGVNIQTGPNGEVYMVWVVYDDWPSDEDALAFSRSFDGGETWESYRIIENIRGIRSTATSKNMRVNGFPGMAVDISTGANSGTIYVTWTNIGEPGENTGNDMDIYMIKSIDQGENWSEPIRVNQDEAGQGHEHFFPWVACDPITGFLSVIFYDDRNVGGSELEVFVANSLDGGNTWEDFRVSDVSFTPGPIPGLASGYFGDYLSIDAHAGMVYPCWTDNRSGNALTYVSPFLLGPPPNTPWIVYESHVLHDEPGNNNGQLDFGESVTVDLELFNWGDTDAQDVNITVSSTSPYITFTDNEESYGDIDSEQTIMKQNAIAFSVSHSAPDGTPIVFDILAVDGNGTEYNTSFTLMVNAPMLAINGRTINDETGNGNNSLDPGEQVTYTVKVSNPGSFVANDATIKIQSSNSLVSIANPVIEIGNIEADQEFEAQFDVTIDDAAQEGSQTVFYVNVQSEYHEADRIFAEKIGPLVEDWETGTTTNFNWVNDTEKPWTIVTDEVYEGTYALKSGVITHNESSKISITTVSMSDDSISFYRKVSSEYDYDWLKFYIDGEMVDRWSGSVDWGRVSFPFEQGEHTFEWEYMKDGIETDGEDCAWIDFIELPVVLQTTAFAGFDDGTCGVEPFVLKGVVTSAQSIEWTTSGDGTFDDPTIVNPTYTPGTEDIANSIVELTIKATNGDIEIEDTMVFSISSSPSGNAGNDIVTCGDVPFIIEQATADNYSSIHWSTTGDGIFTDASMLNAEYIPGVQDIADGNVTLKMKISAMPGCDNIYSNINVSILPGASATFNSEDATLCSGDSIQVAVSLTGLAPWDLVFSDGTELTTSENEIEVWVKPQETAAFTVEYIDANACSNVSTNSIAITVNPTPQFELINDTTICASNSIELDATADGDYQYDWMPNGEVTAVITVDSTGVGFGEQVYTAIVTNTESNCTQEKSVTVTFQNCTGFGEYDGFVNMNMYPNPASTQVYIELSGDKSEASKLEIIDVNGRTVYQESVSISPVKVKKRIPVANLANGTYLVKISNQRGIVNKKLVIQK